MKRVSHCSWKYATRILFLASVVELRNTATLYPFSEEAALSAEEGGRLTCGFDDEQEFCAWYNVQSGGVRFWKARYESIFDLERFDCTSERSFPFEEYFLLAGGEVSLFPQTVAIETRIPCQYENATLSFDFWINSESPTLRLCAISADNYFNCEEMVEWNTDAPIATSIPPSADPFRIRIEISGVTADTVILIDNLRYEGQICELVDSAELGAKPQAEASATKRGLSVGGIPIKDSTTAIALSNDSSLLHSEETVKDEETEPIPTSVPDAEEVGVCEAVTCSFNEEHSCMYSLAGIGSTLPWEHSHDFVGNRLTGIHQNSPGDYKRTGFAYVGKNHKDLSDEVFVMESAKFTLRKGVRVSFDLFLRSYGPQLRVCIDSFDYCPYASPPVDAAEFWLTNQGILVPPGVRKIYFIAGKVRQNLFLAIDNIRVRTESGESYCDTN